ncbi:MAG TPA: tetratricopeptide repeat protein [Planctomycetes bacterium]|nr:tetratricopeptide repeat protein [Planctomycetota bacterium]
MMGWTADNPRSEAPLARSGTIQRLSALAILGSALLIILPCLEVAADVRLRMKTGEVLEGRIYDLGHEYLELSGRLGSNLILKRDVKHWSLKTTTRPEPKGILLILSEGLEVGGDVRFDTGSSEWVVNLGNGTARYLDSMVARTIDPNGICSDDRFTVRAGFEDRTARAIQGVIAGDSIEREDGIQYLRSSGFFGLRPIEEELEKSDHPILRRLQLEERFRMSLPAGITEARPHFLEQIMKGSSREQVGILRETLLEHGSDLYPLLGLLLLDDAQSAEVRTFAIDVLQRTHSIRELVTAWEASDGQGQLALAIALGENGVHVGISTLIEALELEERAARAIAAKKLYEYTGERFDFDPDGELAARGESIRKWRAWWDKNRDRIEGLAVAVLDGKDTSEERRKASDLWRRGLAAEADQRFELAERLYKQAIEIDPTAMGPFVSLGILQYQHFIDYDAALESLHRAIGREPGMGDGVNERVCYYHIGRIYQFGLDFDRARGALLKSVSLDQNYSAAWYELGRIQYEEALLAGGAVEVRRERLEAARETFMSGIMALTRYRRGLIVVDRTNLPFDNALPFSTRDHNRTLRELRIRILEELGRFRGRIGAISLILDEPKRVLQEYREATTEGSVTEELEKLVSVARVILQSRPGDSGEPVPTGGTEDDGEIDAGEGR